MQRRLNTIFRGKLNGSVAESINLFWSGGAMMQAQNELPKAEAGAEADSRGI